MQINTRITLYRDPYGERNWIVATDAGDASEEIVLAERQSKSAALKVAKAKSKSAHLPIIEQ